MPQTPVVIAVDVDDVLAHTAPALIDWSNQTFGSSLVITDFCENLAEFWGVDRAEAERRWLLAGTDLLPYLRPTTSPDEIRRAVPGNIRLLPLTSRRKEFEKMTDDWVQKHYPGIFLPAKSTNFPWKSDPHAHKMTKAAAVREHGAIGLIDDQPKHTVGVHDDGGLAICFGDYHWNQQLPGHIARGTDWQSVGEILHERLTKA